MAQMAGPSFEARFGEGPTISAEPISIPPVLRVTPSISAGGATTARSGEFIARPREMPCPTLAAGRMTEVWGRAGHRVTTPLESGGGPTTAVSAAGTSNCKRLGPEKGTAGRIGLEMGIAGGRYATSLISGALMLLLLRSCATRNVCSGIVGPFGEREEVRTRSPRAGNGCEEL